MDSKALNKKFKELETRLQNSYTGWFK